MSNSKLIAVFLTLSPAELRELALAMQLHKNSAPFKLFQLLHQLHTAGKLVDYDRKSALLFVYPGTDYDDQPMRLVESNLLEIVESFLIDLFVRQREEWYGLMKVRMYAERDVPKAYYYAAERLSELLHKQSGVSNLYISHELDNVRMNFESSHQSRKLPLDFKRINISADTWYIATKLKHACEAINARNVLGADVELNLIREVRSLAAKAPFSKEPAIFAYTLIYDSLVNPDDETFTEKMMHFIKTDGMVFPKNEQRDFFQYLKNFCIKKLNSGRTEYTRHLFDIYCLNLSMTDLLQDVPLSPFEFKNIVTIALRLNEMKWVEDFIPAYLKYIPAEHRENAEVYNLGNLSFFKKDYRSTLKLLQRVEFSDVFYALDVKSIILKAYFEQGEEELFSYQASAFRTFLSRSRQVSDYQRIIYRNFIKFATQLMKADGHPDEIKKITDEMEGVKQVADIRWLREKAMNNA